MPRLETVASHPTASVETPTSKSLVSVIVPTFDRSDCLSSAVQCALAQTHCCIEVLICDDGSTDATPALAQSLCRDDPRVRYLVQRNRGVSAARNLGIRNARGDFIAVLDSDDTWMPWKLETQLAGLAQFPEAGMIWSDMQAVDLDRQVLDAKHLRNFYAAYRWFKPNQLFIESRAVSSFMQPTPRALRDAVVRYGEIFWQMIMGNLVHTSTVLMRRQRQLAVGEFSETMRTGEDFDFHLRTCRVGPVAFLDAASICYQRGRADRLTRADQSWQIGRNSLNTIEPVISADRARINLPDWMIARSRAGGHCWVGECTLSAGDHRQAVNHLATSLRLQPWQGRTALLLAGALAPPTAALILRNGWRRLKRVLRSVRH